ncbi:hypothetical protein K3335_003660 [Salmonella enterica]|nr:hypothetical protein [Salmonella enterica]
MLGIRVCSTGRNRVTPQDPKVYYYPLEVTMSVLNNDYFKLKHKFEINVDVKCKDNGIFTYTVESTELDKTVLKELKQLLYSDPKTTKLEGMVRFYGKVPKEFGE